MDEEAVKEHQILTETSPNRCRPHFLIDLSAVSSYDTMTLNLDPQESDEGRLANKRGFLANDHLSIPVVVSLPLLL